MLLLLLVSATFSQDPITPQGPVPLPVIGSFVMFDGASAPRPKLNAPDYVWADVQVVTCVTQPGCQLVLERWQVVNGVEKWVVVDNSGVLGVGYHVGVFDSVTLHRTVNWYFRVRLIDANGDEVTFMNSSTRALLPELLPIGGF